MACSPGTRLLANLHHKPIVTQLDRPHAGLTPLHLAAWRGHTSVLRSLVNAGASLTASGALDSMGDVSCNKGSTPLHLAAMKVHTRPGAGGGALAAMHALVRLICMLQCLPFLWRCESTALKHAPNPAITQGDLAVIRLLLRAHAKLLELAAAAPSEHRVPRDPRRLQDAYNKTPYTVAFDLGR